MFNTLRRRFILSHTLPLLLVVPLTGIALVYILESQVLLVNLAAETKSEATLLAQIAADRPDIWSDSAAAQTFVDQFKSQLVPRIMLLDPHGRLLASSDAADANLVGQVPPINNLGPVLAGTMSVRSVYGQQLQTEIVDVLAPVVDSQQHVVGVVRLTHRLAGVSAEFFRLRAFIGEILGVALVLGAMVGLVLAFNLERPLRQAAQSVYRLASGQDPTPLPEQGPDEVRVLLHAFNTLAERIRAVEEARRLLLSNLVHELGTPLGALNSGIQALRGGADQQADLRQELLDGMEEEISHLRRLLDDLARLYDRVLGGMKTDLRPLAFDEWLPRVLTTWKHAAQAKGLQWQVDIPDNLPILRADPDRLAQVMSNLLSNAIKYTKAGGTVSVTAGRAGDEIWIRVSDTGVGIPTDEQALIFDPFYRGRSSGRFSDGMGLGLTIAKDLAISHGGRLEVDSAPGKGSRLTLWLPVNT